MPSVKQLRKGERGKMKQLAMRKCSRTVSVVFVACLAFAAQGSTNVFNDAVFWFRGGKDKNSNTYMERGEFFDDLHADDSTHGNHDMEMSSTHYTGSNNSQFKGNAVIQEEDVVFPALGTNFVKKMQVLHIADATVTAGGKQYFFPFDVKPRELFAGENISNEYTVVSRIRLDYNSNLNNTCLMKLGYDSSQKKGMWLGFGPLNSNLSHPGCRRIAAYRTPNSDGVDDIYNFNLYVPTNTWVDLAVAVGNGKLRVGVAVPQSSSSHGDNATIAFDQTAMWTDNCTVLDDENYRFFCKEGQENYAGASDTDRSAFIGSVQQLAIWGRALNDQEVMEAFGMPRPALLRIGFDNGNSHEFGGTRSGATQTIDGLGSWQDIANTMKAGDTWTVNFTALRDEARLPQIFSIKSLDGSAALIEPVLNGTSLDEGRIAANSHAFWPVAANLVVEGENELVIKRKDGGIRDFLVDAMELGGSLGVGKISQSSTDDGRVDPERIKTGVPSAADPNPQHWPTKLEPSTEIEDLHFRVWIDPEVADKASFTLKTAYKCDETSSSDKFKLYVNRAQKGEVAANTSWKQQSLTFNPGQLRGGWNDIDFTSTASRCWEFGYYRFEAVLPSPFGFSPFPGLSVFIR